MKSAPHDGDVAEVLGVRRQVLQRLPRRAYDLLRFLDEDAAHLVVVFEARVARRHGLAGHAHGCQRRGDFRRAMRLRQFVHGLRKLGAHGLSRVVVSGFVQGLVRLRRHAREPGLIVDHGAL